MPAEDIRHPEKQPNSSKGGRKKYKRQKKETKEGGSSVPESGNGTCKGPGDSRPFSLLYLAEVSFISSLGQLEFPKPSTKIALVESERK